MTRAEKATKITQETLMPITLISTLLYLVFQIGGSYKEVQEHGLDIKNMQIESKEVLKTLKSVESRLIKIETSLEVLAK